MVEVRATSFGAMLSLRRTYLAARDLHHGWLVAAAVTLALLLCRAPSAFTHPQFWAEDGAEFFTRAFLDGAASVVDPYAGYLHLVPRLTAWLWSRASATGAPALYAGTTALVVAWSAATAGAARIPCAWLLGIALLLPPHSGEVFGTLTNVQWVMAPVMALCVATPSPLGRSARANQLVFCLASAMSGPFSMFLAPVAAWRMLRERADGHALALGSTVILAAAVQMWCLSQDPVSQIAAGDPLRIAAVFLDRVVGQLAVDHRLRGWRDPVLGGLVVAAAAAALVRQDMRRLLAFLCIELTLTGVRFAGFPPDTFEGIEAADRYFFGSRVILLWAVISVLLNGRRSALLAGAALATIALHDRQWTRPPLPILPWAAEASAIDRGEAVRITINPVGADGRGSWAVDLPARGEVP